MFENSLDTLSGIEAMEFKAIPTSEEIKNIGYRLYLARTSRHYGQKELADWFPIDSAYICRIEKGKSVVGKKAIASYARIFNISIPSFMKELRSSTAIIPPNFHRCMSVDEILSILPVDRRQLSVFVEKHNISPVVFFPEKKYVLEDIESMAEVDGKTTIDEVLVKRKLSNLPGLESLWGNESTEIVRKAVGFRLRMMRKSRNKTQEDIFISGNISPYIVSEIEWGLRSPTQEHIRMFAKALRMSPARLIEKISNPEINPFGIRKTREEYHKLFIGEQMKKMRQARGFAIDKVSGSGISPYIWSSYEKGRKGIAQHHLPIIASIFGLTTKQLHKKLMLQE